MELESVKITFIQWNIFTEVKRLSGTSIKQPLETKHRPIKSGQKRWKIEIEGIIILIFL